MDDELLDYARFYGDFSEVFKIFNDAENEEKVYELENVE